MAKRKPSDDEVMRGLAESMVRAGCEVVVGVQRSGNAVMMLGDDMTPEQCADYLITLAAAIRRTGPDSAFAAIKVDIDDDDPRYKTKPPWQK